VDSLYNRVLHWDKECLGNIAMRKYYDEYVEKINKIKIDNPNLYKRIKQRLECRLPQIIEGHIASILFSVLRDGSLIGTPMITHKEHSTSGSTMFDVDTFYPPKEDNEKLDPYYGIYDANDLSFKVARSIEFDFTPIFDILFPPSNTV
jgi:hypothetical protein